jgi:simple sugar transport system ATP-binding protein
MAAELVHMKNISKSFGKVLALDKVSMKVHEKEIVGLVGDNGAGKSTLIKILSGALRADSGEIYFKGEHVTIENTHDAIDIGIETIYQDAALVGQLSVARNLFLGREPVKGVGFLRQMNMDYMKSESTKILQHIGLKKIDPELPIVSLSGGERQSIAIARAMFFEADLIILDEPTNNLGVKESQSVLDFVVQTKERGHSSLFITHNIHHIYQVADRIVVLRHGRQVGDVRRNETSMDEVISLITGMKPDM